MATLTLRHPLLLSVYEWFTNVQCPTPRGQVCDQKAAIQQIFHLERSNLFYLSAAGDQRGSRPEREKVKTQHSTFPPVFSTEPALNTDLHSHTPEVKPCPMKTIHNCFPPFFGIITTHSFSSTEYGIKVGIVTKAHDKLREPRDLEHEDVLGRREEEGGEWTWK